jgi:hypothetical protein
LLTAAVLNPNSRAAAVRLPQPDRIEKKLKSSACIGEVIGRTIINLKLKTV